MTGRDGGLELVGPRSAQSKGGAEDISTLGDGRRVPQGAILVLEQDQIAVGIDPPGAPGIVQEHEGEQAQGLGLIGHQDREGAGEPDGFTAESLSYQVGARTGGVPLVEEEVQHGKDRSRAFQQLVGRRKPERYGGVPYLALGAHQTLRHGGFRHQERMCDLGGGHAGQGAQRERNLRVELRGRDGSR